jgi:hypothetical protein
MGFFPGRSMTRFWQAARFVLLPFASGFALSYVTLHWRRPDPRAQAVLVLAAMNGALTMTLYPWTDFMHWLWCWTPALLLATFALAHLHTILADRAIPLRWLVILAMWTTLVASAQPMSAALRDLDGAHRLRASGSGDVAILGIDQVQPVVDFINANVEPGGYILEIPGSLYAFLTGRRQAARLDYFFLLDGTLWDESREIAAIKRHAPRFAFLMRGTSIWEWFFPKVTRFVQKAYVPYAKLGKIDVLELRRRPPVPDGLIAPSRTR